MNNFLCIYVLFASEDAQSQRIANLVASHFDGLGMERDGVAYRVPVRFRSVPWNETSPQPRGIDFKLAEHNAIVLLHDVHMARSWREWNDYVTGIKTTMEGRNGADFYIPFGSPTGEAPLPCDQRIQYAQRRRWQRSLSTQAERDTRLLLHVVFTIRKRLKQLISPRDPDEKLFVSHAKADGDDAAQAIVNYVNHPNQDVPLETFYDAKELMPGVDYQAEFEREIGGGTLLAIVSDVYDSRPWCVFELTTAKRCRRPIILADVARSRTSRTYPYGANVPKMRVAGSSGWIEPLLVEAVSEGLRCDLVRWQGDRMLQRAAINADEALVLPRPPELLDFVELDHLPNYIFYPEPPLGSLEEEIIRKYLSKVSNGAPPKMLTMGDLL